MLSRRFTTSCWTGPQKAIHVHAYAQGHIPLGGIPRKNARCMAAWRLFGYSPCFPAAKKDSAVRAGWFSKGKSAKQAQNSCNTTFARVLSTLTGASSLRSLDRQPLNTYYLPLKNCSLPRKRKIYILRAGYWSFIVYTENGNFRKYWLYPTKTLVHG